MPYHDWQQPFVDAVVAANRQAAETRGLVNIGTYVLFEQFKLCWYMQNKMHMPIQEMTRLLQVWVYLIGESNKADVIELARRKAFGNQMDSFDAITLEGDLVTHAEAGPAPGSQLYKPRCPARPQSPLQQRPSPSRAR